MSGKTPLQNAQELDSYGFNVLPAKVGGNHPQVEWREYQNKRTSGKLEVWFEGDRPRDYWIATGLVSGIVVLDCDNAAAEHYWRGVLGSEVLDNTIAVKTKRGVHYYFKLTEPMASWSVHPNKDEGQGDETPSFDIRADLTGVICPPSANKEWIRSPAEWGAEPVPAQLKKSVGGAAGDGAGGAIGGGARSMLTKLLSEPGKGGYNNWFTAVCGHYAKQYRTQRDAYEYHCWEAYAKLDEVSGGDPHPKRDAEKTLESVWRKEQAKDEAAQPVADNGYLMASGPVLLTPTRHKDGEEYVYSVEEWADFSLVALGVVEDEDANRTYDVEIHRKRQGDVRRALLPARSLSDPRSLSTWLAEYGVTIMPPDGMYPRAGNASVRLARYLESQNPPHFKVVDHLGWHGEGAEGGFLTHEGVIRNDGLHPFEKHKPHPRLRNWAPYRYGFDHGIAEARAVLNEVLTFHDETVCSVFGAWWAACLLKPQIHEVSSQFPFMALEAPSESGKTTGFFSLMLQLAGNTQGNVNPTRAALRDYMSAHQSGVVWIDDLDDTQHLMELLRQATGEGSVAKKGEDKTATEAVQLVAPISISGEALNLSGQKALADRAIQLEVPSPTQRKSLKPGCEGIAQWNDIVALKHRYPDLSVFAGTIVAEVLKHKDLVAGLPSMAGSAGGRFGDKIAVLRLGAGLLAALTGNEEHIDRVEAWCSRLDDVGSENSLTLKVIPAALSQLAWPTRAVSGMGRWPTTPVVVSGGQVLFSPHQLAVWWNVFNNGAIEKRTESAQAFEQQARALGLGGTRGVDRRRLNVDGDGNKKIWYWVVPEELSGLLLGRSRGESGPGRGLGAGVHPESMRLALQVFHSEEDVEEPDE